MTTLSFDHIVLQLTGRGARGPQPVIKIKTFSANHVVTLDDSWAILRFNASAAGAGGLVCTVNRNLGALISAGLYSTHKFTIDRDPADTSSNPIIIQDDTGAERGRIVSPNAQGMGPWLDVCADGATVTCRGVP